MNDTLKQRLALLAQPDHRALLGCGLRGIEREALRTDTQGRLALTPHPAALGSALTHPHITTDYAEALLEFITPAEPDIATALQHLDEIHRHTVSLLGEERLWSQSMPCELPPEEQIPIAWYGHSHIGMLKHVYRRGLALRYGKTMQCIAGVHYNFSLAEGLWGLLQQHEGHGATPMDHRSESYIALIRNFNRYSWLLMVLFGASPAVAASFLRGRDHGLQRLSDDTLYLPHATSLRMSDLGYQNNAQAGVVPPYNTLHSYMAGLARAVQTPWPAYERIGMRRDGQWVQINTHILQIENEFYATIRPKQVIRRGERPLEALCARGVQYVEVRCMDIDPFEPVGIALPTARFLDAFLTFCALEESPPTDEAVARRNAHNFSLAVREGRRPGLELQGETGAVPLCDWGQMLLDRIEPVAALLDAQQGSDAHARALQAQRDKLRDLGLTPSARVLDGVRGKGGSFLAFGRALAEAHDAHFRSRPLDAPQRQLFEAQARASLAEQQDMEATQTGDFDAFIEDYRARLPTGLCEIGPPPTR